MLVYETYEQKQSDKLGVQIMKKAQQIEIVRKREEINFKPLYTSGLSENYHYSRSVDYQVIELDGLKVECISNVNEEKKYAIIHLHGGAYVSEFNDTYRKVAKKYLKMRPNIKVFSPLYSLAPEKPYPHALNDVISLYKYILSQDYQADDIIIVGDSAGGGLALAMTLYLRDHSFPLPKAIITMSAWTNLAMNGKSHKENYPIDIMFGEGSEPLDILAYTTTHDIKNPYISPVYGDYDEFTDLLMFVGGDELILSDTLDVAKKAKETNEVFVHNFLGMFHVFPFGFNSMASSRKAWKIIKEYVNNKFKG